MEKRENFRSMVIEAGLEAVLETLPSTLLNAFEVGCMFSQNEGLSTYQVPRILDRAGQLNRFISVEMDALHINKAKQILKDVGEFLLERVEFREGLSLDVLPGILEELGTVSFAFLDGGADPDVCLREFELTVEYMAPGGMIVVDDLQEIEPSIPFPHARPFGKGTLILPLLVMADYLRSVRPRGKNGYRSSLLNVLRPHFSLEFAAELDYRIVSDGTHRLLIVGNPAVIRVFMKKLLVERVEKTPLDYYRLAAPFGPSAALKEIPLKKVSGENRAEFYHYLGQQAQGLGLDSYKGYFEKSLKILSDKAGKSEIERYREASLCKQVGHLSRSREVFVQLLRSAEEQLLPGIYFHLGEIAFLEGKTGEARDYFQKCTALNPRHKKALEFLVREEEKNNE